MKGIKYYPLIDSDSKGREKTPLFFSLNKDTVCKAHKIYLAETVPKFYRLCSAKSLSVAVAETYVIDCPCCGKAMKQITNPIDAQRLSLYCCPVCVKD